MCGKANQSCLWRIMAMLVKGSCVSIRKRLKQALYFQFWFYLLHTVLPQLIEMHQFGFLVFLFTGLGFFFSLST